MSSSRDKEPYVVCLDPESGQVYTLGLFSNNVHVESQLPVKIRERAKVALRRLAYLREQPGVRWWFKSEAAQIYRRRRLPIYLIQQDCARYPTYEAHSNLSLAFKEVHSIELHIDLSEYTTTIETLNEKKSKKPAGEIKIQAALVSGADEVIKNVLRQLYKDYQVKLRPHNDKNKFVLKISGLKEYFIGSIPILAYETVRSRLRGLKFIEVILTEISSTVTCETFPPVVERVKDKVKSGIYDPPDWKKYEDTPFFIWYPPKELPLQKLLKDLYGESNKWEGPNYKKIPMYKPLVNTPCFNFRPKEYVRENEITELRKDCAYSGEIDLPFKVRLCGVDNLEIIFSHFDQGATENGFIIPNYVTKSRARKEDGHGAQGKKKKPGKASNTVSVPKLGKTRREEGQMDLYHCDQGAYNHLFQKLVKNEEFQIFPYMTAVEVSLYHGCNLLTKASFGETKPVPFSFTPRWHEWLTLDGILTSQLPKEVRICFNLKIYSPSGESYIIASTSLPIFDFYGRARDGLIYLNLWPFYKIDPRFVSTGEFWSLREKVMQPKPEEADRFRAKQYARLIIQLDTFRLPLFWSLRDAQKMSPLHTKESVLRKTPTTYELSQVKPLLGRDPLSWDFEEGERELIIKCRHYYKNTSSYLPVFLAAIDWSNPEEVMEAHLMLKLWEPMNPEEALALLDARFPDSDVRLYAVQRISEFSDDDLVLYLLELVQALIYEDHHWSALGEFLLERSLANPHMIGHEFFWLIRSQLHIKPIFERFTLILEQFLMLCGSFPKEIEDEMTANQLITDIAEDVPRLEKSSRLGKTQERLNQMKQKGLPDEFSLSIDPRMKGCDFVAEDCKIMDSKKLPLLLVIKNSQADAKNLKIIFKTGDDLRQDLLTIQFIKIMDKIWLDHGLDLRMKPYRVQSTADQVGMIELVLDSENTSDIHQKYGDGGAMGALDKRSIMRFLKKWNTDKDSMDNAKDNFIRSTAGYSVATFILGIGDRHSGNIMVTRSGHLFHIDFGHFLGHFKKKFGINRERTKFVFTEEMAFVMGGKDSPDFLKFASYCTRAYNLVRNKGNVLISLFIMMLAAGMPELTSFSDIEYLKTQLALNLSDLEATNKFTLEIYNSLDDTFRRIDNWFHALKRTTEKDNKGKPKESKEGK